MPAPLFLSGPCQVCGQNATVRHFGVMSCHACAAFFRRAAVSNRKLKPCQKEDCELFGRSQCRTCRLKRCYEVGMDPSKFQQNRDLISTCNAFRSSSKSTSPPQSLANFLGRPSFILSCEPDKVTHIKTIIDVAFLIEKAREMLENVAQKPYHCKNSLEKLSLSLEDMHSKSIDQKTMHLTKFGKEESILMWEHSFLSTVQWFSNFPEFNELEMDVKMEILKSSWIMWTRLEKLAQSADLQRRRIVDENTFLFTNQQCVDMKNFEIDISWYTNYNPEQVIFYMMPDMEMTYRQKIDLLVAINPTKTELSYMLSQLCLYNAGKKFQGRVLEVTERLLALQADSLHAYYVDTMKMSNYFGRLTKLMKLNQAIEKEIFEQREKAHVARIFDVISVEFSHPEMFDGQ